jgi:hypothetical protein
MPSQSRTKCKDAEVRSSTIVEIVTALRTAPTPCDINLYGPAADFIERRFGSGKPFAFQHPTRPGQ